MKNKFLVDMRAYYEALKDDKGNWRDIPSGVISRAGVSSNALERLKIIITTIMDSDGINYETKLFLSDSSLSMKQINTEMNRLRELAQAKARRRIAPYSYIYTTKKIGEDNEKLVELFGDSIIRDLVYGRLTDYDEIDKLIDKLILLYGTCDKSRSNILIKIRDDKLGKNKYCNNEEFFEILSTLEVYLRDRAAIVEKAINNNEEFIAYFNYLLNSSAIGDKECQSDRERLLKFLHNEDYGFNGDSIQSDESYVDDDDFDDDLDEGNENDEDDFDDDLEDEDGGNDITSNDTENSNEDDALDIII